MKFNGHLSSICAGMLKVAFRNIQIIAETFIPHLLSSIPVDLLEHASYSSHHCTPSSNLLARLLFSTMSSTTDNANQAIQMANMA